MSEGARERLLETLSEPQREVVRQLFHGPVKVVAAAGSGKTRTMATLYALAVLEGLAPSQIMAVTFTERGAAELRSRALATVGDGAVLPEALDASWIGTFHGLMRRLLGERWYAAGLPPRLDLLDESAAAMVLDRAAAEVRRRIAASGPRGVPPGADGPDLMRVVAGASEAASRLRSTELAPDDCRRLSLQSYQRFAGAGDPAAEVAWHRFGLEATLAVWEEYEARLERAGATDFDGLLRLALRALRSSPALSGWCQSTFRLLIVDEYQDTSPIQASLLAELCGSHRERLFVVGDPRQSIFAFRDAQPGAMAEHPGRVLELARNHRSLEPILAAAEHLMSSDPSLGEGTRLEPHRLAPAGHPVLLGLAPDPRSEAEGVAELIQQLGRDGITHRDGSRQPVGWGQIAVLAPTLRRLGPFLEEALRRRGIPFDAATGGLLERPEVKDALALLRAVADPADGRAWVRMLQGPVWRVDDRDLAAALRRGRAGTVPERLGAALEAEVPELSPAARLALRDALELIREASVLAPRRSSGEILSLLVERSGLRVYHDARARSGDPDGARAIAALQELNRTVLAIESGGRFVGAAELLRRLTLAEARGGIREPQPPVNASQVTISTVHRAKGLEWPVVILADCRPFRARPRAAVQWDRGARALFVGAVGGRHTAARVRWEATPDAAVERAERTRLIYVAMTRAMDLLVVTTSRSGLAGRDQSLASLREAAWAGSEGTGEFAALVAGLAVGAPWVAELPGFPGAVRLPWATPLGTGTDQSPPRPAADVAGALARWRRARSLVTGPGALEHRPPPQLSFSALLTIERCPRWFWFEEVAGFRPREVAPGAGGAEARRRALSLGDAAHRVLENHHREHPERGPAPGELALQTGAQPPAPETAELDEMMARYSTMEVASLPTVGVEVPFRWRGWAGEGVPPLVGAIDRVAMLPGGELMVLDYKTDGRSGPLEMQQHARQLGLYALALKQGLLGAPRASRAGVVMLRSGEFREVDTSDAAAQRALDWAVPLARSALAPSRLSATGRPNLPCPICPHRWFCPERDGDRPRPRRGMWTANPS